MKERTRGPKFMDAQAKTLRAKLRDSPVASSTADMYSGSQNRPNVWLFWIDRHGVDLLHNPEF